MSIMSVAASGLLNASSRIVRAGENIARLDVQAAAADEAPASTIEDNLVAIDLATYDYTANLRVLKTDKELAESLLNIVS